MRVDLPAPFSPQIAWTSPRRTTIDTSDRALTPGNSLVIFRISRMTLPGGVSEPAAPSGVPALQDEGPGVEESLICLLNTPLWCSGGARAVPDCGSPSARSWRNTASASHKHVTISGHGRTAG